ncbi:MAG: SIMPL domain-containing protein [Adhaeribacter sp.]
MKSLLLYPLVVLSLFFCFAASAQAQLQVPAVLPPLVNVSGVGEVKVEPNEVLLNVGIDVRNKSLEAARQDSDTKVRELLNYLKKAGIDAKDIQVTNLSVYPQYVGEYGQTTPELYMTQRSVSVLIRKVSRFDEILTGIYKTGANRVEGIEYRTSDLQKHREQARKLAIQSAKEKATAMTKELGAKPGRVYSITESSSEYTPRPYARLQMANKMMESADAGASGPTLAVGQILVRASVEVSFVIE